MRARLVAAVLLGLSAACGAPVPRDPGVIVMALASSPVNLDPAVGLDESSQRMHQLLFSSLLKVNAHLRVVPDLATRFDTTDHQTYTVEIARGVRFHDGREMTADDVAFTFRRFLDPAFVSGRKGAYRELTSVEVVDRYTVAFHLRQPSAAFPINLVMGIVPVGTGDAAARTPVGSGPYRLKEFVPDDHVSLTAFPDYYKGRPANDGVVFKVVPDDTMRGLELRKGDVDLVVNDLGPDMVFSLEHTPGLTLVTGPGTDYAYVGFNLRDATLRDRRVRLAIGYALDTDAIITNLRRGLARDVAGILPSMSWAETDDVFRFHHDAVRARALLDEAGFTDPDGPGPAPRLRLTLKTSTQEAFRVQAAVIQNQLAAVGIALDIRTYEFATLLADVVRGNVQMYSMQFTGISDPDMLRRVYHSTQTPPTGFNRAFYANPEVDRALDAAQAALDENDQRLDYIRAQQLIANDAPMLSLWGKINFALVRSDLSGVTLSPLADLDFLRNVHR